MEVSPMNIWSILKRKPKTFRQYTKTFVTAITIISVIWISISYLMGIYALMAYGTTDLLSDLSKQVCVTILGVSLGYFLKSYFETYSEKKQDLAKEKFEAAKQEFSSDDAVG